MSAFEDYNKACHSYDTIRHAIGSDVIAGMVSFYCRKPLSDIHLLDAGCGTGNYTKALLDSGVGHVTILDASRGMLERAREKLSGEIWSGRIVEVTESTLPRLPYPDSSFDVVLFNLVLHHLETNPDGENFPSVDQAIAEAKRVVKKDGCIAIGTAFPDQYMHHIWFTKFTESISYRFKRRFPGFDKFMEMLTRNKLTLRSKLDHYSPPTPETTAAVTDPLGPTKKAWRDANSYWACATKEEIEEIEHKVWSMHTDGTLDSFVKENHKIGDFFYMTFLFASPL